jgi:ribonuclease HI
VSSRKQKFYVVWKGTTPGVYTAWSECESAIRGYSNAKYKSFPTREAAEKAFREGADGYWGTDRFVSALSDKQLADIGQPITNSMCVDAACNLDTNLMEYRGVWLHDKSIAFQQGPFTHATNNIGEFLAIVHALALLSKRSLDWPIYSDSHTAISWVVRKWVRSKSIQQGRGSAQIKDLVARALAWLDAHEYRNEILKWETSAWGEIPADYGRK